MTATTAPYHSDLPRGHDGLAQLVHAEWTKFRTVRGWMIAALASTLLVVLTAWITTHQHTSYYCVGGSGSCPPSHEPVPVGPGGEAVSDTYYFVHRTLAGPGSITVRVSGLTSRSGAIQPWAKAGLIITASTRPGSAYAAVMVTGAHGVRMQYDYTHDTASAASGSAGSPVWLRLTRAGGSLTGYDSLDGVHWAKIGTARLKGLPTTVQAGLFVTSPETTRLLHSPGRLYADTLDRPTNASATFDQPSVQGNWQGGVWRGKYVGTADLTVPPGPVAYHRSSRAITLSGSGDIAPAVGLSAAYTDQLPLAGVFAGLILLIVVAAMFMTAEFRRGLIRLTLAASPRRGRMLTAKAIVVATVAFVAGAVAAAIALPLGEHILRANGNYVYPTSALTDVRVILGTGALVAIVAVLALALGGALRRSAGAVCAAIVLIVLPYILATASALPPGVSQWLMRVTPAAGFAIQQTLPQYHQVSYPYTPSNGFYPLAPAAGLAVLGAYAVVALAVASYLLRSKDA